MKKFLISFVLLNTLIVSSSAEELKKDCSNISKFSPAFYKCKSGNFIKDQRIIKKRMVG